jgi:hypothetical protein
MKRFTIVIALSVLFSFLLSFQAESLAQDQEVRASLKASVMQRIGVDTDITIVYSRPGVKGRKIWGGLVPYNEVWRAGANENTTFEVSKDVLINGQKLPAGKYGLHMLPGEKEWTIIFSKDNSAWGSFSYKKDDDALRITVTPKEAPDQEWLSYGFENLAGTSATAYLWWEKLKVPFEVEVAVE